MRNTIDIVIKDAYVQSRDSVVDIKINDGRIKAIEDVIDATGDQQINAGGNLVTPGFVDTHVHLDQALSLTGERRPKYNDTPFTKSVSLRKAKEHFESSSVETIEETVVDVAQQAVSNGVLHMRTHAYLDTNIDTKSVEAVTSARERLSDVIDMEVVAFPQQGILKSGTERVLRDSVRAGADLVGGLDPGSLNKDIPTTLDTWFDIAKDLDVDIDVHLHDTGTLGTYTFDRLLTWIDKYDYEGRVTASHSFALADIARNDANDWMPDTSMEALFQRFSDVDLKITTCYLSTEPDMPIKELQDNGIALGHGSDQVRDMWCAHGNINPIEEALIQSLKLRREDFTTNENLDRIWQMMTSGGASILGIEGDYGVRTGTPADIVIHDVPSRQWAIVEQKTPSVVIKDGVIVARNGDLTI